MFMFGKTRGSLVMRWTRRIVQGIVRGFGYIACVAGLDAIISNDYKTGVRECFESLASSPALSGGDK